MGTEDGSLWRISTDGHRIDQVAGQPLAGSHPS
jgi:hypothetical protein